MARIVRSKPYEQRTTHALFIFDWGRGRDSSAKLSLVDSLSLRSSTFALGSNFLVAATSASAGAFCPSVVKMGLRFDLGDGFFSAVGLS